MDEPWMGSAFGNDLFDYLFLASIGLGQELDLEVVFFSQAFCLVSNRIAQRFGELGIIEEVYVLELEKGGHSGRIAQTRCQPQAACRQS